MKYYVGQSLRAKNRYVFHPDIKIGDIGTVISVYNDGKGVTIKFPNVGEQYCNNAEKYLEPITLSTGDMLNELAKNKKAKYVDRAGRKCISDMDEIKVTYNNEASILDIDEQWTLIEEPKEVPFTEAIKAYRYGKTAKCEYSGITHTYKCKGDGLIDENGNAITSYGILHGKWSILP